MGRQAAGGVIGLTGPAGHQGAFAGAGKGQSGVGL